MDRIVKCMSQQELKGQKASSSASRKAAAKKVMSVDVMYQALFDAITEHRLLPGAKLREDELAEAFEVSRTPIREVLQKLNHVGMVDVHPNRGAFVAKPSVKRARDSFEARIILESGIFKRVSEKITPKHLRQLREIIDLEEHSFKTGDRSAIIRYTGEFHIALCNVLGNDELNRMLKELVSRTSVALAVFPPSGFVASDSKHHREIVSYMEKGDADAAIRTLVTTLNEVQRSLDFGSSSGEGDLRDIVVQMIARNA